MDWLNMLPTGGLPFDFGTTPTAASFPTTGMDASASGAPPANQLLQTLRGVQTPKPPSVQMAGNPGAPQARPVQGGLAEIMAMLGVAPPRQGQGSAGLQLPAALSQALGGR